MDDELQTPQTNIFQWQWNKKVLCFAGIFLPLMVSLGFWQLDRAEQKRVILELQQQRVGATVVDLANVVRETDNQFRNVATNIVDDVRVFLVDNKVRHGRSGYEVLMPLRVRVGDGEQWLLLNRGWLPGGSDRSALPSVPAFKPGMINGYLYRSQGKGIVLKAQVWPKNKWPLVIQSIDIDKISAHLGVDIYPYLLRVVANSVADSGNTPGQRSSLETGWQVVNALPEKSVAYAVQWFAMAFALVILTIFASSNLADVLRGRKQETNSE